MEIEIRRRLGTETSAKGVVQPSATLEILLKGETLIEGKLIAGSNEEFFRYYDEFRKEVDRRYPPTGKEDTK